MLGVLSVLGAISAACAPVTAGMDVATLGDAREASAQDASADAVSVADVSVRDDAAREDDASVRDGGASDHSGAARRVLFVGNSYTYVNDLPAMIASMARGSASDALSTDAVVVGGATLQMHWQSTGGRERLQAGASEVVLQGQSVEPLYQPAVFAQYADEFGALARAVSARPVWFATWARRADSDVYAEPFSGGTPAAMTAALEREYAAAATRNGGALARVGEAWRRSLASRPALALHSDDGSHPTVAGTYLAACVMYAAIFGHPVREDAPVPMELGAEDARSLRGVAAALAAER